MTIVGRASAERRGLEFDEEANAKRAATAEYWAEERSKGLFATSRVSDDGMIDPRDTRKTRGFLLDTVWEARNRSLTPNSFGVARL